MVGLEPSCEALARIENGLRLVCLAFEFRDGWARRIAETPWVMGIGRWKILDRPRENARGAGRTRHVEL